MKANAAASTHGYKTVNMKAQDGLKYKGGHVVHFTVFKKLSGHSAHRMI